MDELSTQMRKINNSCDVLINNIRYGGTCNFVDSQNILPVINKHTNTIKKCGQSEILNYDLDQNILIKSHIVHKDSLLWNFDDEPLHKYDNNMLSVKNFVSEAIISSFIKDIISKGVCVNFVYTYGMLINNTINKIYSFMEKVDGNLIDFERIMGRKITMDDYVNILIQIFYALHTLKTYKIVHYDFHFGNILIQKINTPVNNNNNNNNNTNKNTFINNVNTNHVHYFSYKIENETFVLPNMGYIVKICDFGMSQIEVDEKLKIIPSFKDKVYGTVYQEFNYEYDLMTFFITVIDGGKNFRYNINNDKIDPFTNEIKKFNEELISNFIIGPISNIGISRYYFPKPHMSRNIKPLIDICRFVYTRCNFNMLNDNLNSELVCNFANY